jgi:hypothetical protein
MFNLGIHHFLNRWASATCARPGRSQSASAAKRWEGATAQQRATGTALAGAQGRGPWWPRDMADMICFFNIFDFVEFAVPHLSINLIWAKMVNGLLNGRFTGHVDIWATLTQEDEILLGIKLCAGYQYRRTMARQSSIGNSPENHIRFIKI